MDLTRLSTAELVQRVGAGQATERTQRALQAELAERPTQDVLLARHLVAEMERHARAGQDDGRPGNL